MRVNRSFYKVLTFSALTGAALMLYGFKKANAPEAFTQQQLNEQSVLAINWFQQSGEYAALTHQAFNLAAFVFERAVDKGVKKPAVIVDVDETVLNNSTYQAGLIDTNSVFTPSSWNKWIL